ncbi:MAG: short-chain dehydrogenase [Pseudomonadota bacterium]|jgi:NAD(P)-dependent dehydrogenase (short-subunit alcohol dehydrogenase family)
MPQQIALVTGAGSGIGRSVARALLEDGWLVALAGRRPEPLEETAQGFESQALLVPADVSREGDVDRLFQSLEHRWKRLDLLFNNAGIFPAPGLIDEMPVERWREAVDINLTGSFLCARAAFGLMRRQLPQGGRIINNGSISAHAPRPHAVGYTTTKHAITGLTRQLSLDGRPFSIACGQIDIGNAATELAAGFGQGALQADGSRRPEPMMDMSHVADAVRQMAALPLSANVQFMTLMATNMPFVGRG